ncbi:Target of rapamycin complex 1 subunit kog1 [Cryomyces antarcticus]|uniref:Target of rapamycin complex 1 subunit kog1 n=1 Tax=Cryomyces antarcticus TaxID=329879 RepID=A0ABR0KV47_9PEZI|nr:Target of rapamycin complex 1 subunit kog1 [Cryomyces antarcticus]
MVFIWARILAVDGSPQTDLVKDSGYAYFISILDPTSGTIGNVSEHRAMCAFIVAMFCKGFRQAQTVCLSSELIECLLTHLLDLNNPLLRQWSCLCISMLWEGYAEAKWVGIKSSAHLRLGELALDNVPEVRTAMLHALTTFLGIPDVTPQVAQTEETIASMVLFMTTDGDSMVRKELLVFFSTFIARNKSKFVVAAYEQLKEERDNLRQQTTTNGEVKSGGSRQPTRARSESKNTIFAAIWTQVLLMSVDPHPEIARNASIVMDHVLIAILQSPLRMYAQEIMDEIMGCSKQTLRPLATPVDGTHTPYQTPSSPTTTTPTKQDGYFSAGMRRTASVAASFKNLASFGVSKLDSRTATQTSPPKSSTRPSRPERVPSPRSRIPTEWSRPPDEHDTHNYPQSYVQARVPTTRGFQPRDLSESPLVPLKSVFFEWSMEYFREPQMKPTEADEPGSYDYNRRLWRRNRNDRDIALTQPLKEKAGSGQWGHQEGLFDNKSTPMKMVFHQFEEHLVATDDRDSICVWDWRRKTLLSRFSAGNPPGSRLTELRLINEDEHALLMTGSSDGVIKIFRNYESQKNAELVSGFRALTDLVPSNKNAGLVFNWQQGQGKILVAGDERVIRVWSAGTEMCTSDIPARSGSCVTSLTSDQVEGHVFVAGFGDGAIRVYDQRERPQQAMVKVYREHRQWITNVHLQRGGMRELISGCRSGEVRLWDIRMDRSVGRVKTVGEKKNTLRTLSVHEHAPVFAIGSERHKVEVFNTNGIHLTTCEPYTSFLQQTPLSPRLPPISATAFHPHRMLLACAALNDNNINFYRCHSRRRVDIYDG